VKEGTDQNGMEKVSANPCQGEQALEQSLPEYVKKINN
jgi:hypothetical protein